LSALRPTPYTRTVDVGTQTTTVAVPKVKMDSAKIKTPTVTVKKH
jgi:precorrin-6B methylase 2